MYAHPHVLLCVVDCFLKKTNFVFFAGLRPSLIKKKEIGPPLYLKEQGAMTLSSLFLDPAKAAEVGSEAIFKLGENFPSHLLAQHTTLDASQLRALEVSFLSKFPLTLMLFPPFEAC